MIAGQAAGRLCPNPLSHAATEAVLVVHILTCLGSTLHNLCPDCNECFPS